MDQENIRERTHHFLSRHRTALMSRNEEDKLQSFLAVLFSPFYPDNCLGIDSTLQIIADQYQGADKSKDVGYVKAVLGELLQSEKCHRELRELVLKYLNEDGKTDSLHWFIYDLIVNIYFHDKRTELLSWAEEACQLRKDGHRKFMINAPMGLGKTYAMSEVLASGRYSAVVFSPDKALRNYMVDRINRIAGHQLASKIEGIDQSNCPRYEKIINERANFRNVKPAECKKCGMKESGCETWSQKWNSGQSKVLVTTHAQYEAFYRSPGLLTHWYDPELEEWKLRDFFVIDESIIDKHLFEVPFVDLTEFNQFRTIVNKHWAGPNTTFREAVNQISDVISIRGTSILIPYIDKDFELSPSDDGKLTSLIRKGYKAEDLKSPSKNIKALLKQAIRTGCIYDEHSKRIFINVVSDKAYPLECMPMHVFFDATGIPDFLMNKLFPGQGRDRMPRRAFEILPLGSLILHHTNNADLPRARQKDFIGRLEIYCKRIIGEHGERARYFIVALGQDKNEKVFTGYEYAVEEIFKKARIDVLKKREDDESDDSRQDGSSETDNERLQYNYNYAVLRHFGDIRGTNVAKDCDIGLLLGKFKVADAVEVAWAIPYLPTEFIEEARARGYVEIEAMKEQVFSGEVMSYRYKDEFNIVNIIAEWKRNSENEQAIGRTRFLFHPVVFYAVTKDDLARYALFQGHPEKIVYRLDSFGIDLFNEKGDSMYPFSKWAIDKILKEQDGTPRPKFTEKEVEEEAGKIADSYGRKGPKDRAVRKHIQKYLEEHYPRAFTQEWSNNTCFYVIQQ